jgi:hypothetical protein
MGRLEPNHLVLILLLLYILLTVTAFNRHYFDYDRSGYILAPILVWDWGGLPREKHVVLAHAFRLSLEKPYLVDLI